MSKKAKGGSKNNISNRGTSAKLRTINGKVVEPILYDGRAFKHGKYIAAKFKDDGAIARDASGKPIMYSAAQN